MKKVLLLTFILIFSIQGAVITREGMVATANQYIPPINVWTPKVDKTSLSTKWQSFYKTEKNGGNPPYNKMAYCWSGFDTPSELKSKVERKANPLPAGGYNTSQFDYCRNYIAGIDCSGFVIKCWGLNSYVDYQTSLLNYALEIPNEDLKQGDLLRKPGHSIMYVSGPLNSCNIYESQARGEDIAPYYPGVTNIRRSISDDYTPYSIFPQFSDESPEDGELVYLPEGETTIDIVLTIKASGDINLSGVKMFIQKDGEPEKNIIGITLDKKGNNTWELKKEQLGSEEGIKDYEEPNIKDGGNFTVRVIARNDIAGNGYRDEYKWQFTVDPAPPIVRSTDPTKDAKDVPSDKTPITINFSKPMDAASTAGAVQTRFPCSIVWTGDQELQLIPDYYLDYCSEYTITVTEAAMDTAGVHLDGNKDGRAGGNYPFTFTTEPPEMDLYLDPFVANVEEGYPLKVSLYANGSELKKEIDCNMDFNVYNPGGWSISGPGELSFSLSPETVHEDRFLVRNSGTSFPLMVVPKIPFKCDEVSCFGYYWSAQGHMRDHPDENQSPGKMEYPTPWLVRSQPSPAQTQKLRSEPTLPEGLPDIGILLSGWADGFGHIMGKYGIETLPVKPDLEILNNPETDISDAVKLLVIGSAGLKGFNSPTFKQKLEDYVVNGGNLLVFTQKYGEDLSVLPGDIDGYGWNEDQSCFGLAAYFNRWYPVFAGQSHQQMDCNVDGYILEYPADSKVLLWRTKNSMPALLYYNYGAGTVIVSSMYTDWGYGHNQASYSEMRLIRDLTTWAQNPDMEIPEFYYNSFVSVPVSIKYTANDTIPAASAIIKVYTPDRELYDSTSIPVSLNSGEETEWIWEKSLLSFNLGLWTVDYALMDDSGKWIQGYKRGAVFAQKVKVKIGNYNIGDFQVWVNSDKEEVLARDTVNFEIFVKNNTDSTFTGKIIVVLSHRTVAIDSFLNVIIPPDSTIQIDYAKPVFGRYNWRFGLYESDQYKYERDLKNAIANGNRGIDIVKVPFEISLSRVKYRNILGVDTINYKVTVSNNLYDSCSTFVDVYTLLDSTRYDIWSDTVVLAQKEEKEFNKFFFPADYDTITGKGKLYCNLFYEDILWNSASTNFELTYPAVQCSLAIPDSFNYGDSNLYTVMLKSEGSYIPSGKLLIEGNNFSDSLIINNVSAPETTFVFDYNPVVWEVSENSSRNKLAVQYKYSDKTINTKKNLPLRLPLISAFRPVYPEYKKGFMPGDTAEFKAQLALTGNLNEVPMEFCLWSDYLGADTLRDTIILNPCSHRTITLKTYTDISIPADTPISYNYRVDYLNKEYTTTEELQYSVLPPEAVLYWPLNDTFSIGENISIEFTNEIKASSRVNIKSVHLRGDYSADYVGKLFDGPGEVEIPGEGSYTFEVTVPQWITGQYCLSVESEMIEGRGVNLDLYEYGCPIYIDGIDADIQVSTPKDYYGYGDEIPFSSSLANGKYGWSGTETLSVYRTEAVIENVSIWDIADKIDTFGLIPDGSGGLVLDSVYSLENLGNIGTLNASWGLVAKDEWNNFWIFYPLDEGLPHVEKRESPYSYFFDDLKLLLDKSLYYLVMDIEVKQGIIYLSSGAWVYKFSSTTGEFMGCIKPPNREFLHLRGIAIKDNGNIFALEAGTKTLWEFSNYGDSISALFIPMLYGYGDVEYNDGVVYIGNERNILTIEGTSIDSFCGGEDFTKHRYYKRISISDNGKIVVGGDYDEGGRGLKVFSSTGDFEAEIYPYPRFYDMIFYNNDIILCGGWDAMEINVYREFGKENGLIRAGQSGFKNLPPTFLFQGHDNVDVMNSGSISYQVPGNSWEEFMPLESFYGTDYIPPPVYINMQGDWQDSPVFYDCLFNLKVLNVFDSSIVKNGYDLNLSPFDNVPFADTIKDTIPTGDYCVLGKANSSYPQKITSDWKLFTVIGDDLTLLLKSDKEEGFVEDTFRINPITINPLPLEEDSLHLLIKGYYNESETTYVDTSFVLLAETTDSFPFIITPEEPLIIKAELIVGSSDTIRREFVPIITSNRMLALDIYASDIVDLLPFNVTSEVYNYSFDSLSVEVKRIFLSDTLSDSVNLEIEGFHTFVDTFITEQPGTLKIIASTGGVVFTEEKFIDFGMNGVVLLDSLYEVSPDSIEMSGIVSNAGLYPLECDALFCLVEDDGTTHETDGNDGAISIPGGRQFSTSTKLTATQLSADGSRLTANYSTTQQLNHSTAVLSAQRMALSSVHKVGKEMTLSQFVRQLTRAGVDTSFSAIYLSPGKTDTIPIMFNRHDVGDYDLLAFLFTDSQSFMFDSTSSDVNVVGDNQLFVDSLFVSENCDTNGAVRLTAVLDNRSFSPFSGNLTISSPICYLDSLVSLPLHSKDTLEFLLEDPVAEGTYTFTSIISEGGIPVSQKSQDIEFHPIYRFDSLPANLEVSTPDSGIIRFPVRNIGNAKGERNIRVNLADVISIDEYAVIEPAVSDTFINNFLIPEDFPGGEYFADAYILKNAYPEIDTFFNVKVNGLVIKAADSLDKLVYSIDDTADLSILIENQSLWSGDLLASLQYGELELDTSFLLGGMEKGVLNTTTDRDTLYLDTSGVYMFDPINSGSYDSVRINWNASLSDSLIFQMRTDSFIGRGNWITLERNGTYILDDWMQINFANKSPDTQWIDAICLYFNSLGCTKLDTFPPQREIVTFEVPVDSSQEKLGWGIYYPSGRSVVLDEKYIYLSDSLLTIFTDKARYEIFDTVHATLCKNFPDTNYNFVYRVYFSPTEEIWDTFVLARDTMNFSFVIPEWTRSGTYSIDYRINDTVLSAGGLQLSATFSSHKATKNTEGKGVLSQQNPNPQILNPNLTIQPFNNPIAKPGGVVPLAKQWVMGKPALSADGDSAFISGEHLFDVDGITVYFKNAKMDTNFYFNGEKAKIRTEIFSDIDIMVGLNISSTGSAVKDTNLDLKKDMPNKFEFEYPVENCRRGMNELYLHLAKDSMSLAGIVVYFDVYVSDSTAPVIFVLEKPTNTYSSNRAYQLMARIYGPDANGTPIHDTLYYRIASVGGSSWQALLPHSMRGDTHKYLIPSHPNGTHIEYTLIARDESDNRATYPEEGNEDFWVLSPLKPTWNDLTYLADTNAILTWNPPEEMVYYHCGLCSDTIDIEENTIATRFTTQCLPAVLKTIGLEIVKENGALSDTLTVSVYTVAGDSIPGTKTDSFEFTGTFEGYNEFDLTDIQIPENGIFIGVRGSNGLNLLLDGFGEGSHTAIDSNGTWNLTTSGELVIDGIVSHLPTPKIRGASEILTFDVFRSTEQSDWTKIASGLTSSTYTDESTQENQEYSYKIMASFGNPADSFLSSSREVFIDVSPPVMDSIEVNDVGENELVIWAALTDISGIAWDSLGYKSEETINMISEDSCRNNKYFFSLVLSRDTLEYFLKTKDASLLGNYVRYPANGFYKWGSQSGIHELIPDSTYLFRMSNVLVSSNIEIKYALSEESDIQIMFFDILGRKAKTLVDETKKAGYYSASVRSTELPQGIYFLRMKAGDYRKTLKLVKVR